MSLWQRHRSNRAVSPVVGAILMVAVTVILSSVVGMFVFDLGQSATSGGAQSLGVEMTQSHGHVETSVITGSADEIHVLVNGTRRGTISNASPGATVRVGVLTGDRVTVVRVADGTKRVIRSKTAADVEPVTHFDFASGTLANWNIVNGTAWEGQPIHGNTRPNRPTGGYYDADYGDRLVASGENYSHGYWLGGWEVNGDDPQGILRSRPFVIRGDTITLRVGGGNHSDKEYVALVDADSDTILKKETGKDTEVLDKRTWNVSAHTGERVYIRVVDQYSGSWGHINLDHITFSWTNTP